VELARVIGTVVASHKYEGLEGTKFLLVEPLDETLAVVGEPFVVVDNAQKAGPGDVVAWIGGREAALVCPIHFVPVDAAIVSIVTDVQVQS
jgi:microcompartment protein CcmK/EutM